MTQSEFVIEAVLTMNKSGDIPRTQRVTAAVEQLGELLENKVEFEDTEEVETAVRTLLNGDPYAGATIGG